MVYKKITINKPGFHTCHLMKWIKIARYFISEITLRYNGREIDGKSILGVMALSVRQRCPVEIVIRGEDETIALQFLERLVTDWFGEER